MGLHISHHDKQDYTDIQHQWRIQVFHISPKDCPGSYLGNNISLCGSNPGDRKRSVRTACTSTDRRIRGWRMRGSEDSPNRIDTRLKLKCKRSDRANGVWWIGLTFKASALCVSGEAVSAYADSSVELRSAFGVLATNRRVIGARVAALFVDAGFVVCAVCVLGAFWFRARYWKLQMTSVITVWIKCCNNLGEEKVDWPHVGRQFCLRGFYYYFP